MILIIPYIVFTIWLAQDNADRILYGKKIHHWLNGMIHIAAATGLYFISGWKDAVSLLLLIRVTFDTALNLFRGLGIGYVSPKPKSVVDRFEKWVFRGDGITPKILYLLLVVVLQVTK
jgi:hypothetical protein